MKTERTFSKNLETGKIEFHFDKSDYQSMPEADRKLIKSNFLFSSYAGCWVSRSKNNTWSAENVCKQLGATFTGETGEKLSFAEQVEVKQEKAENRAERFEQRAANAEKKSNQYYEASNEGRDFLSLGEPIKIGHHSEKRHRALIERNHNRMGKSVEFSKKAEYYNDRAETAKWTAEGSQYSNPVYLGNRIKECETVIRKLQRYLAGIDLVDKSNGGYQVSTKNNPLPVSETQAERWNARVAEETDKLNFFKEKLAAFGVVIETKETLKAKKCTHVKYRGIWYPVKSFNAKTVTVLNWMDISGAAWTWQVAYTAIKGIKTVEEMFIVYDRDGNENKPTVKF